MTNDGTQGYTYDEANRLLTVGAYSYTYSGLENKRIIVYGATASPTATFNLYAPDGKRLGWYKFGTTNNWTSATSQGFANYLYLGNKPLNYADDRIGSNRSAGAFYPYGNPYGNGNSGAENQSFGTYVQDTGSGLMYADQRYFTPGYGRFMTADPSDANIHLASPISFNRYVYADGDPVNGMDPTGLYFYFDPQTGFWYDDDGNFYTPEELDSDDDYVIPDLTADSCGLCVTPIDWYSIFDGYVPITGPVLLGPPTPPVTPTLSPTSRFSIILASAGGLDPIFVTPLESDTDLPADPLVSTDRDERIWLPGKTNSNGGQARYNPLGESIQAQEP